MDIVGIVSTVAVASGERSYTKLKLINTYLRSTISHFAIARNLDFSGLIKIFADKEARKVNFYWFFFSKFNTSVTEFFIFIDKQIIVGIFDYERGLVPAATVITPVYIKCLIGNTDIILGLGAKRAMAGPDRDRQDRQRRPKPHRS